MSLKSWSCKGCTNICWRLHKGNVYQYCKPIVEKGHIRKKWQGDNVVCLDYTTDTEKTDTIVKLLIKR